MEDDLKRWLSVPTAESVPWVTDKVREREGEGRTLCQAPEPSVSKLTLWEPRLCIDPASQTLLSNVVLNHVNKQAQKAL